MVREDMSARHTVEFTDYYVCGYTFSLSEDAIFYSKDGSIGLFPIETFEEMIDIIVPSDE